MMKGFWVTGILWGVCWHLPKRPWKSAMRSEPAVLTLDFIASRVSQVLGVKPEEVWAKGKYRRIVEARSLLCYWAVRELGVPMSSLARKLEISIPSVSESVTRGRRIAETKGCLVAWKPKNLTASPFSEIPCWNILVRLLSLPSQLPSEIFLLRSFSRRPTDFPRIALSIVTTCRLFQRAKSGH